MESGNRLNVRKQQTWLTLKEEMTQGVSKCLEDIKRRHRNLNIWAVLTMLTRDTEEEV